MFLDSVRERQEAEERQRKERDGEEVRGFKEAVAARTSTVNNPPPLLSTSVPASTPKAPAATPTVRKDLKKQLKGVVVKRKVKPVAVVTSKSTLATPHDESQPPNPKRQKTSDP